MKKSNSDEKSSLISLCKDESLSLENMANLLNCSRSTIKRKLDKYKLIYKDKRFKNGQDMCIVCGKLLGYKNHKRCRKCDGLSRIGKNNSNYKDGRTSLYKLIRKLKMYDIWRLSIFKRDNYKCVKCKDFTGGNLVAHHKEAFKYILEVFLKEYNKFSPIYDKDILIKLAIKYKPFWDINNGITLCKDCHKLEHIYCEV